MQRIPQRLEISVTQLKSLLYSSKIHTKIQILVWRDHGYNYYPQFCNKILQYNAKTASSQLKDK